ncbi:unnamed protein product, partial [Rotaria sp. Silwood1]
MKYSNFQHLQNLVFHQLFLTQLKELRQLLSINTENKSIQNDSFTDVAIGWFIQAANKNSNQLSKIQVELLRSQWLMLLLRCVYSYEHIRSFCSTIEYVEKLFHIYRTSENLITIVLVLKILRQLILYLPDKSTQNTCKTIVKKFLEDSLLTIAKGIRSHQIKVEIITELIYIYRTIISNKSPWQMIAIQMIFYIITTGFKSFELINTDQINNLLATLSILSGCIHPFCLGAIAQVYVDDQTNNNDRQIAMILEIDSNALKNSTTTKTDVKPYFLQYYEINQTSWVTNDQLRIELDVLSPNLLDLPITDETINTLFDALIY